MNNTAKNLFTKQACFLFIAVIITVMMAGPALGAESDYYGNYSGSFTGGDSGLWVAVLDSSDMVFLSYSPVNGYDVGELSFNSENGSIGSFSSTSIMFYTNIGVQIDSSDGSVIGTFSNPSSGDFGDLSGSQLTASALAGSYSGSIAGDASGTWSMTIASNGSLSGTVSADGSTDSFKGAAHPQSYFAAFGPDFVFFGQISGGSVSGEWIAEEDAEGTLTGSSGGGGGGGDDGGGGGGCFLMSLAN